MGEFNKPHQVVNSRMSPLNCCTARSNGCTEVMFPLCSTWSTASTPALCTSCRGAVSQSYSPVPIQVENHYLKRVPGEEPTKLSHTLRFVRTHHLADRLEEEAGHGTVKSTEDG